MQRNTRETFSHFFKKKPPQHFSTNWCLICFAVGDFEGFNDYCFRDSFDHSSTESQLLDGAGKPYSRSTTPVPKMQKLQNSKVSLQQKRRNELMRIRHKSMRVVRFFIPACILAITLLFIALVVVFESESVLFNSLRKLPEMVIASLL